jgi:hypothetical protein
MLQLAADLRLFDEPPGHLGAVDVLLQEDLDGQVATEVDVAAAQDRTHATSGDLAGELVTVAHPLGAGHGVGLRLDHEGALAQGLRQDHRTDRPKRGAQPGKNAAGSIGRAVAPRCQASVRRVGRHR